MQVFVKINNAATRVNLDVNVKNCLSKVDAIKDLFGIIGVVNVNVMNFVMLENIQIMKIVNAEKNQLISQSKNVGIILMKTK